MMGKRKRTGENTGSEQQPPPKETTRVRNKSSRIGQSSGFFVPDSQHCVESDEILSGSNRNTPNSEVSSLRSLSANGANRVAIGNSPPRGNQSSNNLPVSKRYGKIFGSRFWCESEQGPDSSHKATEEDSGNMSFAKEIFHLVERCLETNSNAQRVITAEIKRLQAERTRLKEEEISARQVLGKLEEPIF